VPLSDASWLAALEDAGLEPENVMLLGLGGEPPGGPQEARGVLVVPGDDAKATHLFPLGTEQLASLNSAANIRRFRVVLFTAAEEPVIYGYARHELEHARQHMAAPGVLAFGNIVAEAMEHATLNLAGNGRLYNSQPREVDANAAAADAIRRRYPEAVNALDSGLHAALVRHHGPPSDPDTVFFRTVCFASLFADDVERAFAAHKVPLMEFLSADHTSYPSAWQKLVSDKDLNVLVETASETHPDAQAVQCAPMPGDAWEATVEAYRSAYERALEVLDFPTTR
jgi:hypothetical protein